jgi:hypothetical protein
MMNPINVGIITGSLLFLALLQASLIISGQNLTLSSIAAGQNLYSNVNVGGITVVAGFVGVASAILEMVWPGTVKLNWEKKEEDGDLENEGQESLDEFEIEESIDQNEIE